MYWRPWRWGREGWLGAWIGAILTGALTIAGRLLDQPTVVVVGLTSIPFGVLVGGRFGPRITAGASRIQLGLRAGLVACLLAAASWLLFTLAASFFQPAVAVPNRLVYLLYAALVIPGSVAIVGLPFALPLGVAGAVLVRAVGDHRRAGIAGMAVASVVVVLAGIATWPLTGG